MRGAALLLVVLLAACSSGPPRASVAFTSQQGIGLQQPGGAVHFYRFKASK